MQKLFSVFLLESLFKDIIFLKLKPKYFIVAKIEKSEIIEKDNAFLVKIVQEKKGLIFLLDIISLSTHFIEKTYL